MATAPAPDRFGHFAAIDWSGAVGPRQRGLAVAICAAGSEAPTLVRPGHIWSRAEVLDLLLKPRTTCCSCPECQNFLRPKSHLRQTAQAQHQNLYAMPRSLRQSQSRKSENIVNRIVSYP